MKKIPNLLLLITLTFFLSDCRQNPKTQETIGDYIKAYPDQYLPKFKTHFDKYVAECKAIDARGPIDINALISGKLPKETVGIGPMLEVKEDMVRYNNRKYDPDNAILNDAAYAKLLGHANIMAYPTFAANDDVFMIHLTGESRDGMLVGDLNHNLTFYKSIYPGDRLYYVTNKRSVKDITPKQGSEYQSIAYQYEGSIYNQKAEKVNDVIFRVTENYVFYKPGVTPPASTGPTPPGWIGPDWEKRPVHKYTTEDWVKIKDYWSKEKRQGNTPLYWDDVKVGDQPTATVDGPITASIMPTEPFGMGTGGSRSLRKEIMNPTLFKSLLQNANGVYQMKNAADNVPAIPKFERLAGAIGPPPPPPSDGKEINTKDIHKEVDNKRSILINFFGRDLAIRHLNNWMGDAGWLQNIRWGIMEPAALSAVGLTIPSSSYTEHFLHKAPAVKDKHVTTHGMTNDLAIVKSYVYDKSQMNGENFVELVWWIETIDGVIWEEGGATIKLQSKK